MEIIKCMHPINLYFWTYLLKHLPCIRHKTVILILFMNQSIPTVPISPPGNRGAYLLTLSVPARGFSWHSQFYRGPGWALAYLGAISGHLTHLFSKDGMFAQQKAENCTFLRAETTELRNRPLHASSRFTIKTFWRLSSRFYIQVSF